jgi:membrane-bound lytic murein transglycosylase A
MRHSIALLALLSLSACATTKPHEPEWGRELPRGAQALLPMPMGTLPPGLTEAWHERAMILPALDGSIRWTRLASAKQFFPKAGIEHGRALRSLERFRELLLETSGPVEFGTAVGREFRVFKSAGWDGQGGGVLFTAYCTPILNGSLTAQAKYAFPLYGLPEDLAKTKDGAILGQIIEGGYRPYPTRREIEAGFHLAEKGLELVWLNDPIDAYIAHVNGSAVVELDDGSKYRLGYAGKNGRDYTSLGNELVVDGLMRKDQVSLALIRTWARMNPDLVSEYLNRNDSYVFFTQIDGNPRGSLNVEVSPQRTLATDKTLFPRGALVYVDAILPLPAAAGRRGQAPFRQLMLDQDTGGAIRTAGRADIYLGIGPQAEQRAGATRSEGQLYYLFLEE